MLYLERKGILECIRRASYFLHILKLEEEFDLLSLTSKSKRELIIQGRQIFAQLKNALSDNSIPNGNYLNQRLFTDLCIQGKAGRGEA